MSDDKQLCSPCRVDMNLCSTPGGCRREWCGTHSCNNRCVTPSCKERSENGLPNRFCTRKCANEGVTNLESAITGGDFNQLLLLIQAFDGVHYSYSQVVAKVNEAKQLLQVTLVPQVAKSRSDLIHFTFANIAGDEVACISIQQDLPLSTLLDRIAERAGLHKWQITLVLLGERALLESDLRRSSRRVGDLLRELSPDPSM